MKESIMKKKIVYSTVILILSILIGIGVGYTFQTEQVEEALNEENERQLEGTDETNQDAEEDNQPAEENHLPDEPEAKRYEESIFELPVHGAGGYTSTETSFHESATEDAEVIQYLPMGTPFVVKEEQGNWWRIETEEGEEGWIENQLAMINLPDVLPSIIYDNPNNYASDFRSSFTDIPNVTGEKLYEGYAYNERLDRDEFIMPILYHTAEKIAYAQEAALENGETLVVMETFRPRSVQLLVNEELSALAEVNEDVRRGITEEPWSMNWFISAGVSNHQRGLAVDLTLARIDESEEEVIGDFMVPVVQEYRVYEMYSPIFELSTASAMLVRPISARDRVGWQEIPYHDYVNEEAIRLERYMFEADMIPIPSEWWHFNDIDILEEFEDELGNGDFYLDVFFNLPATLEED